MDKQSVTTSSSPSVTLEVQGNLQLKGWDELEVLVRCPTRDDLSVEQHDDEVKIMCQRDCTVKVPYDSRLIVNFVHGHATIKSLDGELTIQEASGHLNLRSVGPVKVDQVHGNLFAKNVAGDLSIHKLDGNAVVKDVQGDFKLENRAHGNLSLGDIDGDAAAESHGNISLRLDPSPGNHYEFETSGDITCWLPGDASVVVEISEAAQIMISLPEVETARVNAPHTFTLGDGDAEMTLSAKGNVILGSQPGDWGFEDFDFEPIEDFESAAEVINQQVEQQIQAQMGMLEHTLESQLANLTTMFAESGLSPEKAERVAERAQAASERAQAKMQRAQEKLQRKIEAARRRAERKARAAAAKAARDRRRRVKTEEWTPPPPEPAPEPVSDEERLMVLQMLEQGKITTDEAEQLLAALEGKRA